MSDAQRAHPILVWIGAVYWWPLTRVRTELRTALWVLYGGGYAVLIELIRFVVRRQAVLDLGDIGHFVAALGVGALLASLLLPGDGVRAWMRTTLFGLIAGLVFGVIAELQQGPPVDVMEVCFYALPTGVLFPLVRWLALKGSANHRASNP